MESENVTLTFKPKQWDTLQEALSSGRVGLSLLIRYDLSNGNESLAEIRREWLKEILDATEIVNRLYIEFKCPYLKQSV